MMLKINWNHDCNQLKTTTKTKTTPRLTKNWIRQIQIPGQYNDKNQGASHHDRDQDQK